MEENYRGSFDVPSGEVDHLRFFLLYETDVELELSFILSEPQSMLTKNTILLQIHSFINHCGPFKTTGYTSSYKETGKYPKGIQVIHKDILHFKIPEDISKPAIAIQVDSNKRWIP